LASTVANGKGNEWAVAAALSSLLEVPIRDDSSAKVAKTSFESLPPDLQTRFVSAARSAAEYLVQQEKSKLLSSPARQIRLSLDAAGREGDVRDVLVTAGDVLFGVSCKTNHEAFKHPRLSATIDWLTGWSLAPYGFSESYHAVADPIFDELARIRDDSGATFKFAQLNNLHEDFYAPLLEALILELSAVFQDTSLGIKPVQNLVGYVVGRQDFYKVITRPNEVSVHSFNFAGTLAGPKTHLPSTFIGIDTAEGSKHSFNVRFDRGYVFNFRIHNASSRVEPSFKFDVQAVGLPSSEIRQSHLSF
jgi:HaeIII restriction endonuclease